MTIWLEDMSTNGTFIHDRRIGKGNKVQISSGTEVRTALAVSAKTVRREPTWCRLTRADHPDSAWREPAQGVLHPLPAAQRAGNGA